jgi:hypothetical protein
MSSRVAVTIVGIVVATVTSESMLAAGCRRCDGVTGQPPGRYSVTVQGYGTSGLQDSTRIGSIEREKE